MGRHRFALALGAALLAAWLGAVALVAGASLGRDLRLAAPGLPACHVGSERGLGALPSQPLGAGRGGRDPAGARGPHAPPVGSGSRP